LVAWSSLRRWRRPWRVRALQKVTAGEREREEDWLACLGAVEMLADGAEARWRVR
jgi:hypothetical protein